MNRDIAPVSFNMDNVYEKELREYAKTQDKYFSRYVKRLIDRDRSGIVAPKQAPTPVIIPEEKEFEYSKATFKAFL